MSARDEVRGKVEVIVADLCTGRLTVSMAVHDLLALLNEATREAEGWRPIETAPKDVDVVVLGRIPGGRRARACVSRYYSCRDDSPFLIQGWAYSAPGFVHVIEPTHWMPLHEPPVLPPEDTEGDETP